MNSWEFMVELLKAWMLDAKHLMLPPPKIMQLHNNRRKFRSQTSDNMDRWKAEQGRGREKRKIRRKKSRRERVRRKKMKMREKVGKSRNIVFFQWFVALEGRKVGSLKRRVRSQLARGEMKNCTPLWREAHFQVKMYKTPGSRSIFGSWDVEKAQAVVARSTFRSQNVQNTPAPDHFWHLRCRKSARRCGAKHIFKSKCTKHTSSGPLLAVEMSKKCTPLWQNARGSDHFWKFRSRKSARRCGAKHILKSKCTKHQGFGPLLEAQMSLRFASGHYTTLYTPLHSTTLHYTTLPPRLRQGIGTLSELLGRLDDLAAHLALKPLETKRLRKVRSGKWEMLEWIIPH